MKLRPILASTVLMAVAIALGACHKVTVTNAPAGVPATSVAQWYQASTALDQLTKAADAGVRSMIAVRQAGIIQDGPTYASILQAFGKIFQTSQTAKNTLAQIPQSNFTGSDPGFAGLVADIGSAVDELNATGVTGIKNPNSQTQASQIVAEIVAASTLLQSLVKGAS